MEQDNVIVFLDTLGRTLIGKKDEEKSTKTHMAVVNPAILNIMPQQNPNNPQQTSMSVQIIPMVFKELQADKSEDTTWMYRKDTITENTGVTLDFQIQASYANVFNPQPQVAAPQAVAAPAPAPAAAGEPIKLFDD